MSASLPPNIQSFAERFPSAFELYCDTKLYHLTHSRYLASIQSEGLKPNPELFPAEQGKFLLRICRQYGSGSPSDIDYIQNRILDPRKIYLSTTKPDMDERHGYGVPERLMLLMRSMTALSTKHSLTEEERDFARQSFDGHRRSLTEVGSTIVGLEIDPIAPAILHVRLGRVMLNAIPDIDIARDVVRYLDGPYSNNIPISGQVDPGFIQEIGRAPLNPGLVAAITRNEAGWTQQIV